MPNNTAVMKRCVECKRRLKGDRQTMQWCPDCGGEMRAIPYGANRARARGRRG